MNAEEYRNYRRRREDERRMREELDAQRERAPTPEDPQQECVEIGQRNSQNNNSHPSVSGVSAESPNIWEVMRLLAQNQSNNSHNNPRPAIDRQTPPTFNGDRKMAFNWYREFSRVAENNAWDAGHKIRAVPAYLTEKAQTWFYAINHANLQWYEFDTEFKRFYLPEETKYLFMKELNTAKQRNEETGLDYIYRLLELRRRVNTPIDDQQIIHILITGFREKDYRQAASLNRTSLAAVMDAIKNLDTVEEVQRRFISRPFNANNSQTQQNASSTAAQSNAGQFTAQNQQNVITTANNNSGILINHLKS